VESLKARFNSRLAFVRSFGNDLNSPAKAFVAGLSIGMRNQLRNFLANVTFATSSSMRVQAYRVHVESMTRDSVIMQVHGS